MKPIVPYLIAVTIWFGGLFIVLALSGCGSGGKEDDTQSSSQANNDIDICGDVTCNLSPEQVEQLISESLEQGDDIVDLAEVTEGSGLDQQTRFLARLLKTSTHDYKAFVCGCNNVISEQDNDSVVSTNISAGAPAE